MAEKNVTLKVTTVETIQIPGTKLATYIADLIEAANSAYTENGWSLSDIGDPTSTTTAEVVE